MDRKKKVIQIPTELKENLESRMSLSFNGSISDGFILFLNQNIELLRKEEIILSNVTEIKKEVGQIENGKFSENIIKNLFQRPPYIGKKKLIKSLIIAVYSDEWKDIYNIYFDSNGNPKKDPLKNIDNVSTQNSVKDTGEQTTEFGLKNPYYYIQYAELLGKNTSDIEKARKYYEKAIELLPNSDNFHSLFANFLERQNIELLIAKEHYEKALELKPYDAQGHFSFAFFLEGKLNDIKEAREHYEKALAIKPNDDFYQHGFARFLELNYNDIEEARKHYEKALEIKPSDAYRQHEFATFLQYTILIP